MQGHPFGKLADTKTRFLGKLAHCPELGTSHPTLPLDPLRMALRSSDQDTKPLQDRKG